MEPQGLLDLHLPQACEIQALPCLPAVRLPQPLRKPRQDGVTVDIFIQIFELYTPTWYQ